MISTTKTIAAICMLSLLIGSHRHWHHVLHPCMVPQLFWSCALTQKNVGLLPGLLYDPQFGYYILCTHWEHSDVLAMGHMVISWLGYVRPWLGHATQRYMTTRGGVFFLCLHVHLPHLWLLLLPLRDGVKHAQGTSTDNLQWSFFWIC